MLKLYVKIEALWIYLCNTIKLIKFLTQLQKCHVFRDGNPTLILAVIIKYIELEHSNYTNSMVHSRDVHGSFILLKALIETYFETKSSTTLSQILEVLRAEFIERDNNGN